MNENKLLTISVLICTYNRPELLGKALNSILIHSEVKPDEVIVVNGGDTRAKYVVEKFQEEVDIPIKLINVINKNLASNRNYGLAKCTGDIIAMTDDDAEVFPDWVGKHLKTHNQYPEAGAVGGAVIGNDLRSVVGCAAEAITFPAWSEKQFVRTLPGVNISYKHAVVKQIGLQDETLFRGEDVDFNWRVQKVGFKVLFDPSICVYHHHRSTLRGLLNQQYMYGRAYFLVRKKWPEMYCIYPHQLRTMRNWMKLANFFVGPFYEPILAIRKVHTGGRKYYSLPVIFLASLAWRYGMVTQMLSDRKR